MIVMRQKKIFAIVLLLSAVVTGAWAQTTYKVGFDDNSNTEGWTISPTTAADGQTVTVSYAGEHRVKSVTAKTATAPVENVIDLSTLPDKGDGKNVLQAKDGDVLTNTLALDYRITVADGAKVTLRNATIDRPDDNNRHGWAGITCDYNATIVLEGTNTVTAFYKYYPGIYIAKGKTLTIQGTGSLTASAVISAEENSGAGIGGGYVENPYTEALKECGNIVIKSGNITAIGGRNGAGIGATICGGSYNVSSCGNIVILGGTVNATGGYFAAGIGGGITCGNILIKGGTVNAKGGTIGAGIGCSQSTTTCGDIIITGGHVTAAAGDWDNVLFNGGGTGIGTSISGNCGNITISGGTVDATGGYGGAGIGNCNPVNTSSCGNITITGGTVVARGGEYAAGIGAGLYGGESCGEVTITNTVTSVTAYKGTDNGGVLHPYAIGTGTYGYAKKVTIGGTVYWDPTDFSDYPALLDVNWLNDGKTILNVSPFVYEP